MADLIDRAALLEQFTDLKDKAETLRDKLYLDGVMAVIDTQATVKTEPVVHAYWKLSPLPGRPLRAVCSWCGAEGLFSYNMHDAVMYYCHKCGRRMDADAPERAGKVERE